MPDFETSVAPAQKGDVLEADEMWSFVLKKSRKRWIWLVLCRRTRQIVAYAVGGRCRKTCQLLWSRIPSGYRYKRCFTDFYEAYCTVVPARHHRPCGKEEGQTNHVERFNLTLRRRLARLARKTLAFSKSDTMHEFFVRWFLTDYNQACLKRLEKNKA